MNGWIELLQTQGPGVLSATFIHLDLVLEAIALAILIGVPLGIVAARSAVSEVIVLFFANVMQTVPSLALLGFLLILFQGVIGKPPALTALVIYSLLPIVKNTLLGLRGIDPAILDSADGMGMTALQRLRIVELPLALPVLVGGVRIALVASVGMATIAAAIGAEGLGRYIFRGISLSDPRLILLGAIPAALLALACDLVLGLLERGFDPLRPRVSRAGRTLAFLGLAALVVAAGWGRVLESGGIRAGETVEIGSKDSSESILLAQMLALIVEDRTDLNVRLRPNLGGTLVAYNALKGGGIDAYVEYTGTALTTILHEAPSRDPQAVLKRVRQVCRERDGVAVLDSLGFENTFAILMRRNQADALGVRRLSDVSRVERTIRSGFGPEFMNRADGFPGLVQAYDIHFAIAPREMDRNLLYEALSRGSIDLAAGDSTDGRIALFDLVVLDDDRRYFPPYQAVPLVSMKTLKRFPTLQPALNALAGQIDAATMRRLNAEVDLRKRDPRTVASEFLKSRNLIR
jgi:osmoprotectant transport system permease protein